MKKRGYPLLGLAVVLAACGSPTDHRGKTPLVEVDGNFLYAEDVKPLVARVMPGLMKSAASSGVTILDCSALLRTRSRISTMEKPPCFLLPRDALRAIP